MCVLVVCSSIYASYCGILRFIVGPVWLCMHIVDVSEGFMY